MAKTINQKLGHFIHCSRIKSGLNKEVFAERLQMTVEELLDAERGNDLDVSKFMLCAILMGFKKEQIGELLARTIS